MGFFKRLFFGEKKEEVKEEQPIIIDNTTPESREVLENCFLCQKPIFIGDRYKEVNGNKLHKSCAKKLNRAVLSGQNPEELFNGEG